jgi:cytochrome c556
MLWEHLRESARLDESKGYGDRFLELLTDGESAADRLQAALRSQDDDGAAKAYDALATSCNSCHALFRD